MNKVSKKREQRKLVKTSAISVFEQSSAGCLWVPTHRKREMMDRERMSKVAGFAGCVGHVLTNGSTPRSRGTHQLSLGVSHPKDAAFADRGRVGTRKGARVRGKGEKYGTRPLEGARERGGKALPRANG